MDVKNLVPWIFALPIVCVAGFFAGYFLGGFRGSLDSANKQELKRIS